MQHYRSLLPVRGLGHCRTQWKLLAKRTVSHTPTPTPQGWSEGEGEKEVRWGGGTGHAITVFSIRDFEK